MLIEVVILFCLGCYNKILETGWLINNRNLFLTVLEVRESKKEVQAGSTSGEGLLWFVHNACLSHGGRG